METKSIVLPGDVKTFVNIRSFTLPAWITEQSPELKQIREYVKAPSPEKLQQLLAGNVLEYTEKHNIITTRGFETLARFWAGDTTYAGGINDGAVGTGGSPSPALGSTTLQSELYRRGYASRSFENNQCVIDFLFGAADFNTNVSGAITEFGNFVAGGGVGNLNTGRMASFITTGGWTKTNLQSLFVSCQYSFSN